MSNRQIQPVRSRDIQVIRQGRSRSLWGQVWSVTLQPNNFFLALPQTPGSSRQWFWVAILILALNGFSAVRLEALNSGTGGSSSAPIPQASPGDFSSSAASPFSSSVGGSGLSAQPGGFPGGSDAPTDSGGTASDTTATWVTALISATTILVGWFVLAVILCEVPLFNGVRPSFGQNLQIAIWTTVPLGIMAGLQVIYLAAGGTAGASGIAGLLDYWSGYNTLSPFVRSVLLSLTSRLTVFWLWTLVLIYLGGRQALQGKSWAVALVVVVWVLILVLVPVATGAIAAPALPNTELPEAITLPGDGSLSPESTLSEADLFATLVPQSGNGSPEITPNPEINEETPLPEGASEQPTPAALEQALPTPS